MPTQPQHLELLHEYIISYSKSSKKFWGMASINVNGYAVKIERGEEFNKAEDCMADLNKRIVDAVITFNNTKNNKPCQQTTPKH